MNDRLSSSLTGAQRLLLDLLCSSPVPPPSSTQGIRWKEFVRLVAGLGLAPFVSYRLRQEAGGIPGPVRDEIFKAGQVNALWQMRRHAALRRIAEALDQAGIPLLVVKGMALAYLAYPNPYCRSMDDMDLLVPRAKVQGAVQIVRDLGFGERRIVFRQLSLAFASADGVVRIEVHGSLGSFEEFNVDSEPLWDRSRWADLNGIRARVLCPEDFVHHLCLHVGAHHRYLSRLRWLLDLRFYLERFGAETDWQAVSHRSIQIGSSPWVHLTLWLAQELLGAPVPAAFFRSCPAPQRLEELSRVALQHLLSLADLPMSSSFVKLCTGASLKERWEAVAEHWSAVRRPAHQGPALRQADRMGIGGYLRLFSDRAKFLVRSGALRPSAWSTAAGCRASTEQLLKLMGEETQRSAPAPPVSSHGRPGG